MDPLSRIRRFLGKEALERLSRARVAVAGLGAVGSYAVEGLARSGVGSLRLVDFDKVAASNINRQLYALHSTVGKSKVEVAKARVWDINLSCRVETLQTFVASETLDEVLKEPVDLVIDAIDSFSPKVALLEAAWKRGIPVFSSMGAALRSDPFALRWGDVMDTSQCPLASRVRKALRKRGVGKGILCVSSVERVPAPKAEVDPDPPTVDRGRRRAVLGSLPTLTGIFGLILAQKAIVFLSEKDPKK